MSVRFSLDKITCLIFSIIHSGVKGKCGVENSSQSWERSVLTLGSLGFLLHAGYSVKLKKIYKYMSDD